jgi:hypothetical protein
MMEKRSHELLRLYEVLLYAQTLRTKGKHVPQFSKTTTKAKKIEFNVDDENLPR